MSQKKKVTGRKVIFLLSKKDFLFSEKITACQKLVAMVSSKSINNEEVLKLRAFV